MRFRDIVNSLKPSYLNPTTKKIEKAVIAAEVVSRIRNLVPPGRFLKEDEKTATWVDIGDEKARKKAGQALREDAPDLRAEMVTMEDRGGVGGMRMIPSNKVTERSPATVGLGMMSSPQQAAMYGTAAGYFPPGVAAPGTTGTPYGGYGHGMMTATSLTPYQPTAYYTPAAGPNARYPAAPYPSPYSNLMVHPQQPQAHLQARHQQHWGYTPTPQLDPNMSALPPPTAALSQYHTPQSLLQQQPQHAMQSPSERKHILDKNFTQDELQQQPQQKHNAGASNTAVNSSSSTTFNSITSSLTTVSSSVLGYLDNVSLSSSGDWRSSSFPPENGSGDSDSLAASSNSSPSSPAIVAPKPTAPSGAYILPRKSSSSSSGRSSGMNSSISGAFYVAQKERLSPIGDTMQEECTTSDGGYGSDDRGATPKDSAFDTRGSNVDSSMMFDSAYVNKLLAGFILTSSNVSDMRSSSLYNTGMKRSNSFPNISTLSFSDVDMLSVGGSAVGGDTAMHGRLHSYRNFARRSHNPSSRGRDLTASNMSACALTFNEDGCWNDGDNEASSRFLCDPIIEPGYQRAQRMRLHSLASSGGGGQPLFSVDGSDDGSGSDLVSNASSWLKPFKNMPNIGNEQFNPWQTESNRSILSDMSTDLMALDLASSGLGGQDITFASFRAAAQPYQQQRQLWNVSASSEGNNNAA